MIVVFHIKFEASHVELFAPSTEIDMNFITSCSNVAEKVLHVNTQNQQKSTMKTSAEWFWLSRQIIHSHPKHLSQHSQTTTSTSERTIFHHYSISLWIFLLKLISSQALALNGNILWCAEINLLIHDAAIIPWTLNLFKLNDWDWMREAFSVYIYIRTQPKSSHSQNTLNLHSADPSLAGIAQKTFFPRCP